MRAAQFLNQSVIPPASANHRLGAQRVGNEFKYRAGIIIESAHDMRVQLITDFGFVKTSLDILKMGAAVVA
ncbi:hypothetical protein SDC9_198674 [bioreactor metagenome]|uniref:Uncharacterized protein n=1 Tax=bioreactor metagenome TaxID=1076179 RepID=A0A645IV33_9ZZZZ